MSSIGVIESAGFTSKQRFLLFYLICLPLRTSFSIVAYKFRENSSMQIILLLAGILSFGINYRKISGSPWWSRKAHIMSSLLIIASTISSLVLRTDISFRIPSLVLLLDVFYGFITSLVIMPFN